MLIIHTDSSYSSNSDKGGWSFIGIDDDNYEFHINGFDAKTTNNVMGITAVMEAIKFFENYNNMAIYSDSLYVVYCATGEWKRNENIELWNDFDTLVKGKTIAWAWIKAHSGDKYNEMAIKLTKEGSSVAN